MTGAFRPVDPAVMRRAAVEAERTAFKSALDAALRTLAAAALSAALSLGAWQAWRWATASPAFALNEIRFTGRFHIGDAESVQFALQDRFEIKAVEEAGNIRLTRSR